MACFCWYALFLLQLANCSSESEWFFELIFASYWTTQFRRSKESFWINLSKTQSRTEKCIIGFIDSTELNLGSKECFFIQSPAGTGKTFLYNTLHYYVRSKDKITACATSSGIASLLLPNGMTLYYLFKIPLTLNPHSSSLINKNSEIVNFLRKADVIIWDEVPMQHKLCFEVVDRALRDIQDCPDRLYQSLGNQSWSTTTSLLKN